MAERATKLPGNVNHLQKLVGAAAGERGMPPARLQHWLNAMVITAILDRVRDEDGEPIFLLKGGTALELRLQLRARATRDYDAAFRARAEDVLDHLDAALADEYNNFSVTRDVPEAIKNTGAQRVRLRISYKSRSWGSVELELAPVEGNMGDRARPDRGRETRRPTGSRPRNRRVRLRALPGRAEAARLHRGLRHGPGE